MAVCLWTRDDLHLPWQTNAHRQSQRFRNRPFLEVSTKRVSFTPLQVILCILSLTLESIKAISKWQLQLFFISVDTNIFATDSFSQS